MKTVIRLLIVLVAATVVALLLHNNQGTVVLVTGDTLRRTSLSVFIVGLLLLFVVFYFLLRLIAHLLGVPSAIGRWRAHRHEVREDRLLERSLMQSVQGNASQANSAFARFIKYTRAPRRKVLAALQMATNANQVGNYSERDHYLQEAMTAAQTDSKLMDQVERLRIDQLLLAGQAEQALPLIKARYGLKPSHSEEGQDRQMRLYELLFAAGKLDETMYQAYLSLLSKRYLNRKESQVFERKLKVLAAYLKVASDEAFQKQWADLGADVQQTPVLAPLGAARLMRLGQADKAQDLLERTIKAQGVTPALLAAYARLPDDTAGDRLKFLKGYEHEQEQNPYYLLVMGAISAQNTLWGVAEQYWKRALEKDDSAQVHNALASLYDRLGQTNEALNHWRLALKGGAQLPLVAPDEQVLQAADVSRDPAHQPDQYVETVASAPKA